MEFHLVEGTADGFGASGVTDQAITGNGAFERGVLGSVVTGRQSPAVIGGVPGDGALEQEPIEVDQVGAALVSGADNHRDGMVGQDVLFSVAERDRLAMPELSIAAIDTVMVTGGGVIELAVGRFGIERDLGQRGRVRGRLVVVCDLDVALGTGRRTHPLVARGIGKRSICDRWHGRRSRIRRWAGIVVTGSEQDPSEDHQPQHTAGGPRLPRWPFQACGFGLRGRFGRGVRIHERPERPERPGRS